MKKLLLLLGLLFTTNAVADFNTDCTNSQNCYNSDNYIYEGGQDLVDLYNMSGTTNLNSGDDQWSSQVDLGMEWDRWGQTWSHARMSTNGCVNLRSGSLGGGSANCNDYTPQRLPYKDYTLYPLWTDLIRGTAYLDDGSTKTSKMLFKDFGDYVVFGWYYLREYQRNSSNSFEAILYANNSYEFRYRELDIIQHDVVIGEQGSHSSKPEDTKTFLYYNDNQSGYNTFDTFLANYGGPDIENGGSLYSGSFTEMCNIDALYSTNCSGYAVAYFNAQCALNALYDSECTGYGAAYLAQQCGLNPLYSESCTGYATAYLLYQCALDTLYSSACDGYNSAYAEYEALQDAIYGNDDTDMYGYDGSDDGTGYDEYGNETDDQYGYDDEYLAQNGWTEEDLWYDEEYEEYLDPNDPCYENACENFTEADWYALDIEQFGQEQVDEWYGQEVQFAEDGSLDYESYGTTQEEFWDAVDEGMDQYDIEQEQYQEELAYLEQLASEEEYAEMFTEEAVEYFVETVANMETDADWYDYEVETFGQEQVDEWWGEEVSFDEEGYVSETFALETSFEEVLMATNAEDIYILEETIGVEIFVEEEWSTEEVLDIYEEVLEDYEREVLEEQEDEVFEEFDEEYEEVEEEFLEIEDEAFEELINEEELEELFEEASEQEEELFEEDTEELEEETRDDPEERAEKKERRVFRVLIAQQDQIQEQKQEQTVQQAVSQQETSQAAQAVVAEIDFGGSEEVSQTVAEVVSSQMDDGSSGSSSSPSQGTGGLSSGSVSYGNDANSGSLVSSSAQQEQFALTTGDSFVVEQVEQQTGQSQIQVGATIDSGPVVSAFEVAEQQAEEASSEQMVELVFEDGSSFGSADQNFETSFDDALGAGQSIGQFLSNQAPSFAKFDVAPPTQSEQRTTEAVESLADRVGAVQAQANLQEQFESVQESGGFDSDQTATVAFLGYSAGFSQYTDQAQIADKDDWYMTRDMYKDNKLDDNQFSFYMMAGKTQVKLQEMIMSQYD